MKILTAEAMRAVDRRAIDEVGIPGPVLMENAALGVADAIGELFPEAEAVAILCGPGNNGGDGLALARHLDCRGYEVSVLLCALGKHLSEGAESQLAICRHHEIDIVEVGAGGIEAGEVGTDKADDPSLETVLAAAREHDLVVDALFGTGLDRPLTGGFARLAEGLADLPVPVLAVDLPSGLSGNSAEPLGPHAVADATVTFATPKIPHVFAPASEAVGELVVADLGIPPRLLEEAEGDLHLLRAEELVGVLPERDAATHKGDYGHVLLVAGSPGKAGAAALAARAAVRAGAGLVTAAVPEPVLAVVDGSSLESMTLALAATATGQLAAGAVSEVLAALDGKDVLALGPGLGQDAESAESIRQIVRRADAPVVLDADGLNAFAGHAASLRRAPDSWPLVLTPHPGELARLLGTTAAEIQSDRLGWARRAAEETGAVVVLKGRQTLIAEPLSAGNGGPVWVNTTGNPGMATGGSGDVLTGVLATLLAQLGDPMTAACLAVFVHGLAGDLAAEEKGEISLTAGDLIDHLPRAFQHLTGDPSDPE